MNNEPNNVNNNSVSLGSFTPNPNANMGVNPMGSNIPQNVSPDLSNNLGVEGPVQPLTEENEATILNMNNNVDNNPVPMENNNNNNNNVIPPVNNAIPPINNAVPPVNNGVINEPVGVIPEPVNLNPFNNEIGTVPPMGNTPINNVPENKEPQKAPKKKGVSKLAFVLIILLALAAVGFGFYIFLHIEKTGTPRGTNVVVKNVEIEIGSEISSNITDYADFKGIDSGSCTLDTTDIKDTSAFGAKYTFKITCTNNKTYEGNVTIVDKTEPKVVAKDAVVNVGDTVGALDFIESCEDKTKCSYAIKNESEVLENLKNVGEYEVTIIVRDEGNNEVEVTSKLIVNNVVKADLYINCTSANSNDTYKELTKFGIINSEFVKSANRIYTFYLSEEEYNTVKEQNGSSSSITYKDINGNDITGVCEFDDEKHTLTITTYLSYEALSSEVTGMIPSSASELRSFYNDLGYSCSIGY